jgi:7-cyano-7-deazaguanine synthase in queuosine biosynthesis
MIPNNVQNIGIKMSGGADSTLLFYILCKTIKDTNSDCKIFPITRSCESWTNDFSKHCGECWWCKEREWGFGRL